VPPGVVQFVADQAERVLERVGVAAAGGLGGHRRGEHLPVCRLGSGARFTARAGHDPPRRLVPGRVVRQHLELVPGVERHQVARPPRPGEQAAQPGRGEDALGERFPQPGVVEAALVLDRQQRMGGHHPVREQAASLPVGRLSVRRVTGNAVDAATGGLRLEHVAVQAVQQRQGPDRGRVVGGAGPVGQPAVGGQPQRLPWRAEADGHLRAAGDPLHVRAELVGEEPVAAVPAVEPDLLAEEATGHPDPGPGGPSGDLTHAAR